MTESPLVAPVVFHLGPAPISVPVLGTCGGGAALAGSAWLASRRRESRPSRGQSARRRRRVGLGSAIDPPRRAAASARWIAPRAAG